MHDPRRNSYHYRQVGVPAGAISTYSRVFPEKNKHKRLDKPLPPIILSPPATGNSTSESPGRSDRGAPPNSGN
jgi:hypothetical protein